MELKILIGISASGKSTWAKNFVSKNDKWCIVSRDDLRYAWQDKGVIDLKLENIITDIVEHQIQTLLSRGYSVIYDATNLKASYLNKMCNIVRHLANVSYQIFDIPKEIAIERDSKRERSVGRLVIEKQYEQYLVLLDTFDFGPIRRHSKKYIPPVIDSKKLNAVIFDIDGTIAHTSDKRSPYDYSMVHVDDVDFSVKWIQSALAHQYVILFVSGREDSCREETKQWLFDHGFVFAELLMRKSGDSRKDSIIKEEIFWEQIDPKYNVIAVFDDRDQVVKMWRSLGLKCFQCEPGNF